MEHDTSHEPTSAANAEPTPLEEIERTVQARAKQAALDPGADASLTAIRSLVDSAVAEWNHQHRLGTRPFALTEPDTVIDRALRNLTGYGPLDPLLADDDVWEIMINAPDSIFVKRHSGESGYHHESFHDDDHVTRTLTKILDDAPAAHRKLDPSLGLQDAQLATGARVHIVHSDLSRGGHTLVNIRKFTGVAIRSLPELVGRGTLTLAAAEFLQACVAARLSLVFAGPPGSGKTTLLSCCVAEVDPELRVVIAEEVFEADVPLPNVAGVQTRAASADRAEIDLRRLVTGFLRMAPDVAIVGEVRDREALPLLLTLSSGVTGFTTIHAGSARQALTRLRFVCQLSEAGRDLPVAALNGLVSETIDVVVVCRRTRSGPQVTSITCVEDMVGAADGVAFTTTEVFESGPDRALSPTGQYPVRAGRALADAGYDVRDALDPTGAVR